MSQNGIHPGIIQGPSRSIRDASKAIKKPLRINTDNKNHCYALNARAQERYGGFPWWSPSRYPKVKVDTEGAARCAAVNERRRSRRWNNVA